MSRHQPAIWPPFVRASLGLALTAGFGLGGALFAAGALGLPTGGWWAAAAQAHGHIQLFGWAGLLVFGVGFHFLPRLRGAPLARPARARAVLWLLLAGLVVRGLAQPAPRSSCSVPPSRSTSSCGRCARGCRSPPAMDCGPSCPCSAPPSSPAGSRWR